MMIVAKFERPLLSIADIDRGNVTSLTGLGGT